ALFRACAGNVPIGRSNCLRSLALSTAFSSAHWHTPTSSAASAISTRSRPACTSPPSASPPPLARTDAKRRVASIVSRGSICALPASTRVALSPSTSTITDAESASGTSTASPFVTTPTVPRCAPVSAVRAAPHGAALLARAEAGKQPLLLLVAARLLDQEPGRRVREEGRR